ncbi:hypothetical protein ES703_20095 [subsurface metagenome]
MVRDYVHLELDREIESISGTYTPLKESRLNLSGRDILYVVGMAVVDTACCGSGSFLYATVPGHVVTWKGRIDESGLSVSQVEPVEDETIRHEIAKTIMETESINNYNVNFW